MNTRIASLAVRDWRNAAAVRFDCDAPMVVLHGSNAQGKTNLLEAVGVLATLRSFRERSPGRWIRDGAERASIEARVSGPGGPRVLRFEVGSRGRDLRIDGLAPPDLADWFALVRAVVFGPEHVAVVRGGAEERRRFVDRAAFTLSPAYLHLARDYRRVVRQKVALLRSGRADAAALAPWNEALADLGSRVVARRRDVVGELAGPFAEAHADVAGLGTVDLRLRGVGCDEPDLAAISEALRAALASAGAEEIRRGQSLLGPHRDDLEIRVDGADARHRASQGQARTLVLALKLAEIEAARRQGERPLFLLDDLTSELDRGRRGRLIDRLGAMDNQVWVTTTEPDWLPGEHAGKRFEVAGGDVRES